MITSRTDNAIKFLAVGCGSGYLPWMPGTWGSVVALLPFFALVSILDALFPTALLWRVSGYLVVVVVVFVAGIYICGHTATLFAAERLQERCSDGVNTQNDKPNAKAMPSPHRKQSYDDGRIVWDELVGMLLTLTPCLWQDNIRMTDVVVGLLLFRLLDATKFVPPTRWIDRQVGGGLGIMLDDVVAGGYAMLAMLVWFSITAG